MNELVAQDFNKDQVISQVRQIQEIKEAVMKQDVHYGVIPGCKQPTLYKQGAEKLAFTFRLAVDPQIEDLSTSDAIRYRVKTRITHAPTEMFVGSGIGECSSDEEKYRWRKASKKEWEETNEDRRRVKHYASYSADQVRTNPADVANTILKMAKKRSLVDGILTVTAAGDIFAQDLEDLPEGLREDDKPTVKRPQKKQIKKSEDKTIPSISRAQQVRLFAIAKEASMSKEELKSFIKGGWGYESTSDITKDDYEEITKGISGD